MASFSIHLAVGTRYCDKFKDIHDQLEFFKGILAPDLAEDKEISHYGMDRKNDKLKVMLAKKVDLVKFLKEVKLDSDFNKGIFVHLLTDYIFFTYFFDEEYLESVTLPRFSENLYYSYDITNDYLAKTYNINIYDLQKIINAKIKSSNEKICKDNSFKTNILPMEKLKAFIEYCSDINLLDYADKILKANANVLPCDKLF